MPNLRIIFDNLAAKATLTASSTAGSLVAANMLNDTKVSVHRSTGTSVTYMLIWATPQVVGAVALPATNLTATATIQVRLYSDTGATTLLYDSAPVLASASGTLGLHGVDSVNANHFSSGGATKAAVWCGSQVANVRRCDIFLVNTGNPAGYIDCARIVVGPYWEAPVNPNYGATAGTTDLTKTLRTESGDSVVTRGAQYQTMRLQLEQFNEATRATLAKIIRSAGAHTCLFFSLLPGNTAATAEQDHMIYGRRASGPFTFDFFNSFSTSFEIEGW